MESPKKNSKKLIGPYVLCNEIIGEGDIGQLFKGFMKDNPEKLLCVNQISISIQEADFPILQKTIETHFSEIRSLEHENIRKLYDVIPTLNNIYFFYEYMNEGTLESLKSKLSSDEILICMKQIVQGLVCTSSKGIIHRDLRTTNIYFCDGIFKIANYRVAEFLEDPIVNKCNIITKKKNPLYIAPEIFYKQKYTPNCDVWSTGIIFYELLYHKHPWYTSGMSVTELFQNITSQALEFPKELKVSYLIKEILQSMLQTRADHRINIGEVKNHDIFQKKLPNKISLT